MRKIIEKFNIEKIKRITPPNKHLVKYFLLFILLIFVIPQEANASFTAAAIALGWLVIKVAGVVTAAYATGYIGFKALGVYRMINDLPDGVGGWIVGILEVLLAIAERLADFAGYIFEMSIELAINIFLPVILNSSWVQAAWVAFRDLANIFFIFILLYIAIGTILQLSQVDTKRMLTKVIIIALILNFSGFFTKIVIDATNVLAYDFLQTVRGETNQKFLSTKIKHVSTGNQEVYGLTQEENPLGGEFGPVYSRVMSIIFLLFAYILQIWVFMAGAILFFIRSLVLVFLYILSPMAFFSLIVPGQEKFSKWWHKLTTNALVAPVFMFFIVVFINMITAEDGISHLGRELSKSIQAAGFTITPLFTLTLHFASFFIAYGILVGGMIASVKMGAIGAKMSAMAGATITGYAVAQAGRQTLGRAGGALAQSETLQKMAKEKGVGGALARTGLRSSNWMSKGSFDIRSAPGVGEGMQQLAASQGLDIGQATGAGGFKKATEDKEKKKIEKEEEFMKMTGMDEAEKKEYIEKRSSFRKEGILRRINSKQKARVRKQMIGGTMSPSEQVEQEENIKANYDAKIEKVKTEKQYDRQKTLWENTKTRTDQDLESERRKLKENEAKAVDPNTQDPKKWRQEAEKNKQRIDALLKEREEARKAFADIEDDIARLEKSKKAEIGKIKKGGKRKPKDEEWIEKLRDAIKNEEETPPPSAGGTSVGESFRESTTPPSAN